MKKSRSIHLLFILLTIAVIACFWMGFLFGKETQRQSDLIAITEAQLQAQTAENISKKEQETETATKGNVSKTGTEDSEREESQTRETNAEYSQPQFYLKESGEYVSVYVAATEELYFETDILVADLPVELQEELEYGLDFYSLESVYIFLENYSS